MNNLLVICTYFALFSLTNEQTIEYATRFRNFSIESETGSAHLICFNIYQDNNYHKISAALNITKEFQIKNIVVVFNRCSFEKSECENFQRWKFTTNLKQIAYMKNQLWSPVFDHIIPKLDFQLMKKNIYKSREINVDAKQAMIYYPEVINYFWRVDIIMNDHNARKALVMKFEAVIFSFVKRNKTRVRGSTSASKP